MKKMLLILPAFCILTIDSFAQITFIKHYGEFTGQGNSLIVNSNNNYIIAGRKSSTAITYELNIYGDTLWLKQYGTDSLTQTNQIIQTIDGGYAAVGSSTGFYGSYRNIYLVKTTNTGSVSWTKQIGGMGQENGTSIVQIGSGEYFIGGTSTYNSNGLFDFYLLKTDINGDTLWTKKYGGSQNDEANSMRQTSDGGFILSGYSESFSYGSKDFYLVKTNSFGDTLWTKHYGGSSEEISKAVRQTSDGGYILTGYSKSFGISTENMYVVKTNSFGDTLWTKTYGQAGRLSWGKDIIQTTDGGYAVTGLIKIANANVAIALYLVKIDAFGNVQWEKEYNCDPTNTSRADGRSILQTADGGFAISGAWFSGSTYELLFIKTNNNGTIGIEELKTNSTFNISPNPFSYSTTLQTDKFFKDATVTVYNSCGQTAKQIKNISGQTITLLRDNLPSGLYFIRLTQDNEIFTADKLIITD